LGALYSHGFERLAGYLDEVVDELPPPQRLAELGLAYRQFALDHPALYQMMTGRPFAEFEPPRAAQDRQTRSFQILQEAVADCIDAGHYRADLDPREVADIHWATVHGAVGLEIAGFYDDPQVARQRFGLALQSVAAGFRGGA
jgi:AcrR family transcriptional regulator